MKKILPAFLFLFLITGFASPCFAQLRKDIGACKGKIVSVNPQNSEVIVHDYASGSDRTFKAASLVIQTLNPGMEVLVIFKKSSSNVAQSVKVISGKSAQQAIQRKTDSVPPVMPSRTYSEPGVKSATSVTAASEVKESMTTGHGSQEKPKNNSY